MPWLQRWVQVSKRWKRVSVIADLLEAGHEVLTAKKKPLSIRTSAAVEIERRISRNDTDYKISEMPDK